MEKNIQKLKERFAQVEKDLQNPQIIAQIDKYRALSQEYDELREYMANFEELAKINAALKQAESALQEKDEELKKLAQEELEKLSQQKNNLEQKIKISLLPKDPLDKKDIIIEIRAGAGGDEAALFAANLFRMYTRYAENKKWAVNLLSSNRIGIGGFKEVIFEINGYNVYSNLKYESGVHRVQRVPETEKSGRIHTSTATVAVLPEAEDVDLKINDSDLRIDVFRAGGHGGQSVNTTDSAVRITYLPTGMIVTCQDEKSQHKNKDKAMKVLKSRLLASKQEEEAKKRGDARRSQIGTGDRSEKIRTYNYPQDRITDHRIKQSWHEIVKIIDGGLDPLINALKEEDCRRMLEKA
jgi:peptide chain release factor 1